VENPLATVGILSNPLSGKDIRRLVACGTVSSNEHKTNILLRLLLGLDAAGVDEVVIMPDVYGTGLTAREKFFGATPSTMEIAFLRMPVETSEEDSYRASLLMRDLGVCCIITVGGDGTNRLVAKGCDAIPILPLSTGTNNVFPFTVESTVAGMAAGIVAKGVLDPDETISQRKKLEILKDNRVIDMALIDAVVVVASDIGSKAIWDVTQIKQIVQTCGSLSDIGLSSIGGCVHHIECTDRQGLSIEIGRGGLTVAAPIGPGLIREVSLKSVRIINIGDTVPIRRFPSMIALDGERQVKVRSGDKISIRLTDQGPRVVEVFRVLKLATEKGLFATFKGRKGKGIQQLLEQKVDKACTTRGKGFRVRHPV
jgi:predicted polyphosphate/ATP-dependent NAD kinase